MRKWAARHREGLEWTGLVLFIFALMIGMEMFFLRLLLGPR